MKKQLWINVNGDVIITVIKIDDDKYRLRDGVRIIDGDSNHVHHFILDRIMVLDKDAYVKISIVNGAKLFDNELSCAIMPILNKRMLPMKEIIRGNFIGEALIMVSTFLL
jgi:hypothetical protein